MFAAISSAGSGHLYIYDMSKDKHTHLCDFPAFKSSSGLHVTFNPVDPIIVLGDESGVVQLYKLPKNLAEGPMQPVVDDKKDKEEKKKEVPKTPQQLEYEKMEAFLCTQDKIEY